MRAIQKRKAFINNHPKKLELTRKIIEARPNSKIITFSNNIKMAESIGIGYVYTGKESKKKNRIDLNNGSVISSTAITKEEGSNELSMLSSILEIINLSPSPIVFAFSPS